MCTKSYRWQSFDIGTALLKCWTVRNAVLKELYCIWNHIPEDYSWFLLFYCITRINWIMGDAVHFFRVWNMHVCRAHMYIHVWNYRNISVKFITGKSVLVVVRKIWLWFLLLPYNPYATWNRLEMLFAESWSVSEHCKYSLSFISSLET